MTIIFVDNAQKNGSNITKVLQKISNKSMHHKLKPQHIKLSLFI